MSEYFSRKHGVSVTITDPTHSDPWAEVSAARYPDGSVKNSLDAEELREVAAMLNEAADEFEGDGDE